MSRQFYINYYKRTPKHNFHILIVLFLSFLLVPRIIMVCFFDSCILLLPFPWWLNSSFTVVVTVQPQNFYMLSLLLGSMCWQWNDCRSLMHMMYCRIGNSRRYNTAVFVFVQVAANFSAATGFKLMHLVTCGVMLGSVPQLFSNSFYLVFFF